MSNFDGRGLSQLRDLLLDEASALELVSDSPHPNIVQYHGCRVKGGLLTGIVLGKIHGQSLHFLKSSIANIDFEPFINALTSAIKQIHARGLAHNDICPQNIMVSNGQPILIDFGSCREAGDRMAASGGSTG